MQLPGSLLGLLFVIDVSVPSIGSKAVQLKPGAATATSSRCFSTLYRVEGCAASRPAPADVALLVRFSTLYRVEGCAAPPPGELLPVGPRFSTLYRVEGCAAAENDGESPANMPEFQYPLSGRRLCSKEWLQLYIGDCAGFSTLYRVEGCAARVMQAPPECGKVSVPSIGSKAVQLSIAR